jgi:hypothetical protein
VKYAYIILVVSVLLSGCGKKSVPKCDSDEVKEMILEKKVKEMKEIEAMRGARGVKKIEDKFFRSKRFNREGYELAIEITEDGDVEKGSFKRGCWFDIGMSKDGKHVDGKYLNFYNAPALRKFKGHYTIYLNDEDEIAIK